MIVIRQLRRKERKNELSNVYTFIWNSERKISVQRLRLTITLYIRERVNSLIWVGSGLETD